MNPLIKNLLIAAVAITVIFFGYQYFSSSSSAPSLQVSTSSSSSKIGRNFLINLVSLQKVKLDLANAILNDQSFVSLKDMSVSLPNEDKGRPNPFVPTGNDSTFVSANIVIPSVPSTNTGTSSQRTFQVR